MTKIFYDGCDISKFGSYPNVVGFTTNTSIMRQANQLCYKTFYEANKEAIQGRPISFQIFSDNVDTIREQARQIKSLGESVYVKIPVINSQGESLLPTIVELAQEGVRVNVTAVFTKEQLDQIASAVTGKTETSMIVSVFGGRISDTGVSPQQIVKYAVDSFRSSKNVEVLWAGIKDNMILEQADEVGCQIVTLPDTIMTRIGRLGQSLENLSRDTVASFLKDAVDGGLRIL